LIQAYTRHRTTAEVKSCLGSGQFPQNNILSIKLNIPKRRIAEKYIGKNEHNVTYND